MKNTSRILIIAAVLLLNTVIMSSCSKETKTTEVNYLPTYNTDDSTATKDSHTEEDSSTESLNDSSDSIDTSVEDTEKVEFDTSATISETVIYDENDVKITSKELKYSSYDIQLDLMIENNRKTPIKVYSATGAYSATAINKYHVPEGYCASTIPSGKKAVEDLKFSISELQLLGINGIGEINYGFCIMAEDESGDLSKETTIYKGVKNIKTSQYEKYKNDKPSIKNLVKTEGLTVKKEITENIYSNDDYSIPVAMLVEKNGSELLIIEFENNSKENANFLIKDMTVNGVTVSSGSYDGNHAVPGGRCYVTINIDSLMNTERKAVFADDPIDSIRFNVDVKDDEYEKSQTTIKEAELKLTDSTETHDYIDNLVYDKNGLKISSKGLTPDQNEERKNIHLIFVVQNNTGKEINIRTKYDSFSINGIMTNGSNDSGNFANGKTGMINMEVYETSLEKLKVNDVKDVKDVELTFEIKDENYNDIDEVTVKQHYD